MKFQSWPITILSANSSLVPRLSPTYLHSLIPRLFPTLAGRAWEWGYATRSCV